MTERVLLHPGGRVVELLRSCYSTQARLTQEADPVTIVWQWARPDAGYLPYDTSINSRQWDDPSTRHPPRPQVPEDSGTVGEVIGAARQWDAGGLGAALGPLLGTPQQWLEGVTAEEDRAVPNERRCCCGLTPHPRRVLAAWDPPLFGLSSAVLAWGQAVPGDGWGWTAAQWTVYVECWRPRSRFLLQFSDPVLGTTYAVQDWEIFRDGPDPLLGYGTVTVNRCCPLSLTLKGLAFGDLPIGNPDFPPSGNAAPVDVEISAMPDIELGLDPSSATNVIPPAGDLVELGLDPSSATNVIPPAGDLVELGLDPSSIPSPPQFRAGAVVLGFDISYS